MNIPSSHELALVLLPPTLLHIESIVIEEQAITVTARRLQNTSICPVCQTPTPRLHSHYQRTLRDLPRGPLPVQVIVHVRRFRCARRGCPRRIFTERLPDLVAPFARSTYRYRAALRTVGIALGGNPGSRLGGSLRLPASSSTLIRALRSMPLPPPSVPQVIGVDDFAKRKGQSYGTIIIDLERHRPLDLLEDRTAPTLAAWLRTYPSLEIICSDRSTEYARGIAEGAPTAIAVADRWHLLKNLREALERLLDRYPTALGEITLPVRRRASPSTSPGAQVGIRHLPAHRSAREKARGQATRERRQRRFDRVRDLHREGMSLREIARQVGLHRSTVTRYVRADGFPDRARRRPGPGILAPFVAHLERRWSEGCRNGLELLREIHAQGFSGSRKQLARWVQQRRECPAASTPTKYRATQTHLPAAVHERSSSPRRASARQLAWLLVRRPDQLDEAERAALRQMQDTCADVAPAYALAQRFGEMIRGRRADCFDAWVAEASSSGIADLKTFAAGLRRDEKAVRAALTYEWSNGQTEGQVTKLNTQAPGIRQIEARSPMSASRGSSLESCTKSDEEPVPRVHPSARVPARLRRRDQRLQDRPLRIGKVAGIRCLFIPLDYCSIQTLCAHFLRDAAWKVGRCSAHLPPRMLLGSSGRLADCSHKRVRGSAQPWSSRCSVFSRLNFDVWSTTSPGSGRSSISYNCISAGYRYPSEMQMAVPFSGRRRPASPSPNGPDPVGRSQDCPPGARPSR